MRQSVKQRKQITLIQQKKIESFHILLKANHEISNQKTECLERVENSLEEHPKIEIEQKGSRSYQQLIKKGKWKSRHERFE